jgi:pyridoxine 5-phosphate synthase
MVWPKKLQQPLKKKLVIKNGVFMNNVKLGVNIDHIATIRQARRAAEPDPVTIAALCELAGADGITVHLREDRRHIQDRDVDVLRQTIKTKLNLEMAATDEMVAIALQRHPDDVCIVPEKRQELTTEGGLDAAAQISQLKLSIKKLTTAGICVSLFIDPDEKQVRAAHEAGADCVELHTGKYAEIFTNTVQRALELERLRAAGKLARDLGLLLNAGHGLDYRNVAPVAAIPGMNELNIGFSIIARSVFVGITQAVQEMRQEIAGNGRGRSVQ